MQESGRERSEALRTMTNRPIDRSTELCARMPGSILLVGDSSQRGSVRTVPIGLYPRYVTLLWLQEEIQE